jgi:hypothetical protein
VSAPVVTVEDFRARFPEFSLNDDAQVQTALDDALPWNGYAAWGKTYVKGVCTLAAHFLAVANQRRRGAGGNGAAAATGISTFVSGRKAGALSTNYSTVGAAAGSGSVPTFLALTSYGQEWYSMARIRGMGAVALGLGDTGLPGEPVGHDELGPYRWPGV